MAVEILLPRLGWTMEEGTFVEWLKKDGDAVQPGDVLYTVESDKSLNEVEAFDAGILRIPPNSPAPGAKIPVGALLAYILQEGESLPLIDNLVALSVSTTEPQHHLPPSFQESPISHLQSPAISPRARRVATEMGVDWATLKGSGRTGRIVERDVRAVVPQAAAALAPINASPLAQRLAADLGVDLQLLVQAIPGKRIEREDVERAAKAREEVIQPSPSSGSIRKPISSTRRIIAERMATSAHTAAPVTLMAEVDATELVKLREQLKADARATADGAITPSYNDLLAKICAHVLREYPALNARIEGDEIVTEASAHIGIAVDTERGLLVAVVRDVQDKTLRQIAAESQQRIARAREGKAKPDELRGSTFTITNLGMYEIDAFTPIINLPECAIFGIGRIAPKQVVVDAARERVAIRQMMTLSLTFDHRMVDGAPAARFLQRVKQLVQQPYLWLVT